MRRILILGGTGWLGAEIAAAAVAQGHQVTALARGISGFAPSGVQMVHADRTESGAYAPVQQPWDEVIELSYAPELVESALDALAAYARHWTLISSVSVYARNDQSDADETAQLLVPEDLQDYADAKVHAENISRARLGSRLLIIRPGLISGPGDPSDRFGYWPGRFHRGGRVLAPEPAHRWVQTIDVTDLADFILGPGSTMAGTAINAVGLRITLEEFFAELQTSAPAGTTLAPAEDSWLLDHGVNYWSGPRSLPLWLPLRDAGFAQRSNDRFVKAGGTLRSLSETIARVLVDETRRGLDRTRRSGLSAEEEADLLRMLPPATARAPLKDQDQNTGSR